MSATPSSSTTSTPAATMRHIDFIAPGEDRWTGAPADQPIVPAAYTLLSWAQWLEAREQWPAELPVGVLFPNDGDLKALLPDLPRLALVALPFPKWTDGRAYSLARVLRVRHRFAGSLRAVGDVIPDMAAQLHRTGFDAAVLRAGESIETARRMLNFIPEFYQADAQQPRLRFARGAAGATAAA
jgi:uncharacterized protein (DUF934 family)